MFSNPFQSRTRLAPQPVIKTKPKARARTDASHDHIGRVKALPCACCEKLGPSDAHHIREGQGGAQRAPDWLAIPLCKPCHTGTHGVHGDKTAMHVRKLTELDMLADTIRKLTT